MKKILVHFVAYLCLWLFSGIAWAGLQTPSYNNLPYLQVGMSGNQSLTTGTTTVASFNTVLFDTCGCFSTSTFKYTPTTPGKYLVLLNIQLVSTLSSAAAEYYAAVFKNGVLSQYGQFIVGTSSGTLTNTVATSAMVTLNGTTDYIQAEVNITAGTSPIVNSPSIMTVLYIGP